MIEDQVVNYHAVRTAAQAMHDIRCDATKLGDTWCECEEMAEAAIKAARPIIEADVLTEVADHTPPYTNENTRQWLRRLAKQARADRDVITP